MILVLISLLVNLLIFYLIWKYFKHCYYWKQRKVPFMKPTILFGNYFDYIFQRKHAAKIASEICKKFPSEPYIGTFYGPNPTLIVQDPDTIRLILVKDFNNFSGREVTDYAHGEPTTTNVFFNGGDEWKVLRYNLTPLFSSSKIKKMFPIIKDCANELDSFLDLDMITETVNVTSLLARYTMECIMSCAFGIKANTLKKSDEINPFVILGEKLFDSSVEAGIKLVSRAMWPSLFYGLGFRVYEKEVTIFFKNLFKEASDNRLNEISQRDDFLDLIMEWKNNSYITGTSTNIEKTGSQKLIKLKVTEELLAAQCTVFFAAGFETTSSTMSYLLYELAKNKRAQNRVIEEVDDYLQRHDGVIDYECVNKLPYLESCIDEALRLYPVLGILTREVMDDYTLPAGVPLQKGTRIHIPVYHIHRDPNNFQEPEVFRPERFLGEERKNIKQFTFLPFGGGHRFCIGMRFAKMPIHAGLLTIFKKYRVELSENMPLNLEFKPTGIVSQPANDIYLKFIRRKNE